MTRLAAILLALKIAAPNWHHQHETAIELFRLEHKYEIPAELVIADVEHESRWHERAVNPTSGASGLMQIMPSSDPVVQSELLTWRLNLRRGAAIFALARRFCRKRGYGEDPRVWLWLPTGWDSVSGSRCGHRGRVRLKTPEGIEWLLRRAASLRHVRH